MGLKKKRLLDLKKLGLKFFKIDISKTDIINPFLIKQKPDVIIHLAAQAGVRYSILNPKAYVDSNIVGFFNMLEGARALKIDHFIYASSSSVYGGNTTPPFNEKENVDTPQNLYAASKKCNELISYSYSHLFKIPCTGLRFFTVYGPWGRPDMAYFKFTKSIFQGTPIQIYGHGKIFRDFTYIDDIVDGVFKILKKGFSKVNATNKKTELFKSDVPWEIFNIGNSNVVSLEKFIEIIENCIGKKAIKQYVEMQPGDMELTSANIEKIQSYVNFKPKTSIDKGLPLFVDWYKSFYNII